MKQDSGMSNLDNGSLVEGSIDCCSTSSAILRTRVTECAWAGRGASILLLLFFFYYLQLASLLFIYLFLIYKTQRTHYETTSDAVT